MVPWWKRLWYLLESFVLAAFPCGALLIIVFEYPGKHIDAVILLSGVLVLAWISLPGWILAIPFLLLVKNTRGWRFWRYLAIGFAVQPTVLLGLAFYLHYIDHARGFVVQVNPATSMGTAMCGMATLIYLLLLRREQRKATEDLSTALVP